MSFPTLAEHVVSVLARLMTGRAPRSSSSDMLLDTVVARLRRVGALGTFDLFAQEPLSQARQQALVDLLNDQFRRDPLLRDTTTTLVTAVDAPPKHQQQEEQEAKAKPIAAQRERTGPRPPVRLKPRHLAFGVGGVAAFALAIVLGRVVYLNVTEEAPPDGNVPCGTFWALPQPEQHELLQRIFEARDEPALADDPYIIQSILYACGQKPTSTIRQIVESRA